VNEEELGCSLVVGSENVRLELELVAAFEVVEPH
jgi:hypothetical protein